MLRFSLFGIPVTVELWFWLTAFLLGGGLEINPSERESLIFVAIWMALVFVSILIHELGHALSGRKLAGGQQSIRLWAFGGLAYHDGGRWTTRNRLITIFAGPGAGFLFFVVIVAGILLAFPGKAGVELTRFFVLGGGLPENSRVLEFLITKRHLAFALHQLLWINLWWGLVNLLPVYPLDGGQAASELIPSRRRVHLIGVICGAGVAVLALAFKETYVAIMFGFLAWQNYEKTKRFTF